MLINELPKDELTTFPQISFPSDSSILIRFGDSISRRIHEKVFKAFKILSDSKLDSIRSIHPAYNTILITLNCGKDSPLILFKQIKQLVLHPGEPIHIEHRTIEIPVCYEDEYAPDISFVAEHNKLSIDEVINIHSKKKYLVYFLGFSPGFTYLGEMPKEISTPRLDKPRIVVPAGSVAIGGDQTGIYPVSSPGGWRIIGRTPLNLFNPGSSLPTLLKMSDYVKFEQISKTEFLKFESTRCR